MPDPRDPTPPSAPWTNDSPDEGEPHWAQSIRDGRKARGDRLRAVFAGFDEDDDPANPVPTKPADPGDRLDQPEEDR